MLSNTLSTNTLALQDLARLHNKRVIAFDLETTGLDVNASEFRIIEVGVVSVDPCGSVKANSELICPEGTEIPGIVKSLTGIDNYMVKSANLWGDFWGRRFLELARDCISIGFNSRRFDIPAVCRLNQRYSLPAPVFHQHIDLMRLPGPRGSLAKRLEHFGLNIGKAHRALADVWSTIKLFNRLVELYGSSVVDKELGASH